MKYKKFFMTFVYMFGIGISLVMVINYHFDYYGVFSNEAVIKSDTLNDRFVKMKYLISEKQFNKYDSYLWGSSRTMKIDTRITGLHTYNLGSPAGMTEDCLKQLKQLIEAGALIKTIYIGLDDLSYFRSYVPIATAFRWRAYEGNYRADIGTYFDYLVNPSVAKNALKTDHDHASETLVHENGMLLIPSSIDEKIEKNPIIYVQDRRFTIATENASDSNEFNNCLKTLQQIAQLCAENNIQMYIFFNPQHMTTYLADDMELMNRFKKELVKISPFWDFSGVNYVTANNYFWYETSHPRAFICDKILDTVSGQNQITWVPDFGVYVTPENVDAFCEKAVRDRAAYDPNHEQWIPSPEERKIMTKRVNY